MEERSQSGSGVAVRSRAEHLGPERRRPFVLDAALRLVAERGAMATTMEAIAAEAGVTKPVVYACYPSKRELMRALLRREEQRLTEHMRASLPDGSEGDAEAKLAEGLTAFLEAVAAEPDSYRVIFMSELGPEPAVRRSLDRAREAHRERIAELVRGGLAGRGEDPQLMDGVAVMVASVVMGASEGAVKLLLADPAAWKPDQLAELLAALVARGLEGIAVT